MSNVRTRALAIAMTAALAGPGLTGWAGERAAPQPPAAAGEPTLLGAVRRLVRISRASDGAAPRRPAARRAPAARRVSSRRDLGFTWPVRGPISSPFGVRADPFDRKKKMFHRGVDIVCDEGDRIPASKGGRVIWASNAPMYGLTVVIQHEGGWSTLYSHLKYRGVSVGDWVRTRQVIGRCGHTGKATGAHLHFEIRAKGKHYNPLSFLR